jgi:hypothetical protein
MKIKTLLILVLSYVFLTGITNWESWSLEDISWKVWVFFCNNKDVPTSELQISTMPWNKNEICLYFVNDSDTDIQIDAGIVDWVEMEWGLIRTLDCGWLEEASNISNYIEKDRESPLSVPANTRIIKNTYITFPVWIEWQVPTCLVYSLIWNTKSAWDIFSIKFRTAYYLDFFVVWDFTGDNKISIKQTEIYMDPNWAITIDWIVKNDSALNNIVNITWTISNIFWYHKVFSIQDIKIKAWTEFKFSNKDLNINNYLPRYKWLFNIKLDITYKPYFDFDIKNLKIDKKVLEEKNLIYSTNYFEMPRIIFWILILIIILLFLVFRKPKTKIVYVNQNNPQP